MTFGYDIFADFAFEIVKLLINQHRFWFISNAKSVVNDLHETSFISKWINAKNVVAKCLDLSYPTNLKWKIYQLYLCHLILKAFNDINISW